jgi:mannose-1-phosphate guanylyltransferase/phosphomannomutase
VVATYTKISGAEGGIHVRLSPFDQRVVDIRFIDREGLNLSKNKERHIERIFFREDFRRVYLDDIGSIEYADHVRERYVDDFLKHLNTKAIQDSGFNLVINYADPPLASLLPVIFEKLKCNVVALNANVDITNSSYPNKPYFQQTIDQLRLITTALGAQMAVHVDPGGEKIILIDDQGNLLPSITACAVMADLALRDAPGSAIVIPDSMPTIFEKIAARHDGRVIRTELEPDALINATYSKNVIMGANGRGNYIFPDFQCAFDGMMAMAKLLEYLATQKISLSSVVSNLPAYHMANRRVSCLWEEKPRVMRLITEKFDSFRNETGHGIKVSRGPNKWVLIFPDPDQPYFQVITEGTSIDEAEMLADEYAQIIERITPLE